MQKPVDRTNSERREGFEQNCNDYKRNGEHNCKFVCVVCSYGALLGVLAIRIHPPDLLLVTVLA